MFITLILAEIIRYITYFKLSIIMLIRLCKNSHWQKYINTTLYCCKSILMHACMVDKVMHMIHNTYIIQSKSVKVKMLASCL